MGPTSNDRATEPNFELMRQAFRRRREEVGLSIDDVASRSGLDRRSVIRLSNGDLDGTVRAWHALAAAVQMPLSHLVSFLDET